MTISATITKLAAVLATTSPAPARVFANMTEAVNLADFPCIVIGQPDRVRNTWTVTNRGWKQHEYTLRLWIFVGSLAATPFDQLNDRAVLWPDRLGVVLTPDALKISGSALTGTNAGDQIVIAYSKGQIEWGDGNAYYGLMADITFLERFSDW